jgi:hypothetical protein
MSTITTGEPIKQPESQTSGAIVSSAEHQRQSNVLKQTSLLWKWAAVTSVPVAIGWALQTAGVTGQVALVISAISFAAGTIVSLILTITGSLASIRAWRLTAHIADLQDQQLASVHSDVNLQKEMLGTLDGAVKAQQDTLGTLNSAADAQKSTLAKLDQAVATLQENLRVQTEEIQRGRETIRTERRVRSFFRIRELKNKETNPIYMYRLEVALPDYNVCFTPVTEDYCIGLLEQYLNFCRQSADIPFHVAKRSYPSSAIQGQQSPRTNHERGAIAIYFDLEKCRAVEGLKDDFLPVKLGTDGAKRCFRCEGFDKRGEEPMTDAAPAFKAVIARFRHEERQIFVVAGLSQQGTLAAGSFLELLFTKEATRASYELHVDTNTYKLMSGVEDDSNLDGSPAPSDFCCIIKASITNETDCTVKGFQVDALYYQTTDSKNARSWVREL